MGVLLLGDCGEASAWQRFVGGSFFGPGLECGVVVAQEKFAERSFGLGHGFAEGLHVGLREIAGAET
ncbi:hypothetical protein ACFYM5_36490 [Streptomyces sp. NPDC006706]|uniref:hypothetical protein n=1 Tax=Streptomyces sp. NPDC006706 TaxID=3364761 RepID=UPI003689EA18